MSDLRTDPEAIFHSASAQLTPGRAPHILIADGNPTSRQLREAQLRTAGFRVSVARTGFEAIVKASCEVPDVILLDNSLSDLVAAETGRLLTTCPVTSHIPVVCLTRGRRLPQRMLTRLQSGGLKAGPPEGPPEDGHHRNGSQARLKTGTTEAEARQA
jgi:CheY-like chemotaxis protein